MSDIWAHFAHEGKPLMTDIWEPYTKENGCLMVLGGSKPIIRTNHDRKLEEIIDRHCFKQLDEFRKTHQ